MPKVTRRTAQRSVTGSAHHFPDYTRASGHLEIEEDVMDCEHRWIVTSKPGLGQKGVCKKCDAERTFTNAGTPFRHGSRKANKDTDQAARERHAVEAL